MSKTAPATVIVLLLICALLAGCEQRRSPSGLEAAFDSQRFRITVSKQRIDIFDRQHQAVVFSTHAQSLLSAHRIDAEASLPPRQPVILQTCSQAVLDRADPYPHHFQISGHFATPGCDLQFQLRLSVEAEGIRINVTTNDSSYNRLSIGFDSNSKEYVLGFGAQPSHLNFKGRRVPIWTQHKATEATEAAKNADIDAQNLLGKTYSAPLFHSSRGYSVQLLNPEFTLFDFRRNQSNYLHIHHHAASLQLWSCRPLSECLAAAHRFNGNMAPLPPWAHRGVWVEPTGSASDQIQQLKELLDRDVSVSAIWSSPSEQTSIADDCPCGPQTDLTEWLRQQNIRTLSEVGSAGQFASADPLVVMDAGSPANLPYVNAFRVGEQSPTWDRHHGLQSALTALLNGGLSGQTLAFADTGGHSTQLPKTENWLAGSSQRGQYLLERWLEVSAFLPIFNNRSGDFPNLDAQIFDANIIEHFAFFAKLFTAMAPYREALMQDAYSEGLPLVRHPYLQFPDRKYFLKMEPDALQFMLGDSIMVAPLLTPRNEKTYRQIYLPQGTWTDLWTGIQYTAGAEGLWLKRSPVLGRPPVFLLDTEHTQELLIPALRHIGFVHLMPSSGKE